MIAALLFMLAGCGNTGFAVVSIRPIYGWDVGCETVKVSGHGFADDASVRMADNDLESIERPTDALNTGFYLTGVVPEAAKAGPVDVVVSSGSQTSMLSADTSAGYFYVACPGASIDVVEPQCGVSAGAPVTLHGCGLDAAGLHAVLVDGAGVPVSGNLPLVSDCRTGIVHFDAPALPDGVYWVELVDAAGVVVLGAPCDGETAICDAELDSAAADSSPSDSEPPADSEPPESSPLDSSATTDTGTVCVDFPISFGGTQ